MTKRVGQTVKLSSIEELLGVPNTEGTVDLDVQTIYPFENHPFKVVDDKKMNDLVESIKERGVLTPVLVRPDDEGTYEMISGHRRLHAAKRAGLRKIPAIIKEMTNDDATIAMVDSNVQREEVLPSEKAFAYKMKLNAIKHQGVKRTSPQVGVKLQAADIVGETSGVSGTQVSRIIRLTELIPKLLDMVDQKRLAVNVGVEISFLNKNYQQWLYEYIHENGMLKLKQVMELRKYRDDDSLTQEQMIDILIKGRATSQTRKKITITEHKLSKFFPANYTQPEIERIIVELLEQWKQEHESEEQNNA
ncbi:ParB/RepB/Spo0J family partition protein [Butyrivibrio sp. WCD3002]|uniref:ParB/RepB/Spo0J family partition protein n=1 Tax=Butyrivibrio sp. WCD3002 TaxID=1280676 RepID=UPI000420BB3D|nr:ParB/RepB/Spo0J family partition protein [Butyrivibrio sp. WCD3002]